MFDKHLKYRRVKLSLQAICAGLTVSTSALGLEPQVEPTPARALAAIVEDYVHQGETSNLALANQNLEWDKSRAALTAARARFFPEVALNARYTRADGGRDIDFPVGQLLNPAYQTLNELLVANGGAPRFPTLADQAIPLQRAREQDTRITLRQPLYAPSLAAELAAAQANLNAADYTRQSYQRALRRDITLAYCEWLKARSGADILTSSEALLAENLRVNESLYSNGKSTHDAVLRARAEWLNLQQQRHEANNGADQARSYLNFLLNQPLTTPLEAPAVADTPTAIGSDGNKAADLPAVAQRPDLLALDQAQRAASEQWRAARAARRPYLALGVDAGTQGVDYGVGHNYNFVTGSLVLTWTLFDAGARSARVSQARLASAQLANQREQLAARIGLEVQQTADNLRSATDSLITAEARVAAARAAFTIASRRRDAGMASQLEFLDARSELTSAELNRNLTHYTLLERQAEYVYARGDLP